MPGFGWHGQGLGQGKQSLHSAPGARPLSTCMGCLQAGHHLHPCVAQLQTTCKRCARARRYTCRSIHALQSFGGIGRALLCLMDGRISVGCVCFVWGNDPHPGNVDGKYSSHVRRCSPFPQMSMLRRAAGSSDSEKSRTLEAPNLEIRVRVAVFFLRWEEYFPPTVGKVRLAEGCVGIFEAWRAAAPLWI